MPHDSLLKYVPPEIQDMSKASQRGFTLIELVVVIVILGVLAAFAVPRFMGLEREARVAAIRNLSGSVRSAATMAHSAQIAQGLAANAAINVEGTNIPMALSYPTRASIDNLIGDLTGFAYAQGTGTFSKTNAPTPAQCSFTYTAPAAINLPPTISVPVVTGC